MKFEFLEFHYQNYFEKKSVENYISKALYCILMEKDENY